MRDSLQLLASRSIATIMETALALHSKYHLIVNNLEPFLVIVRSDMQTGYMKNGLDVTCEGSIPLKTSAHPYYSYYTNKLKLCIGDVVIAGIVIWLEYFAHAAF